MMLEVPLTRRDATRRDVTAPTSTSSTAGLGRWANLPVRSSFSWAGDRPRMSTWRRRRKCRGWSPSTRKRCPPALCCCTLPGCKSPPPTVYGPRCESSPGPRRKLVLRQILLRACPAVETNGFNRGWYDPATLGYSSWRELPLRIRRTFLYPLLFTDSIAWVTSSAQIPNEIVISLALRWIRWRKYLIYGNEPVL